MQDSVDDVALTQKLSLNLCMGLEKNLSESTKEILTSKSQEK